MGSRSWHLVCYDVRDDKRLRRVAKLLEGYGGRMQYSVFRCRLTQREVERLRWELTRTLDAADTWMIVPLCAACASGIHQNGTQHNWETATPKFLVV